MPLRETAPQRQHTAGKRLLTLFLESLFTHNDANWVRHWENGENRLFTVSSREEVQGDGTSSCGL